MNQSSLNRRKFLKGTAAASGALWVPSFIRAQQSNSPSAKLGIAAIGVGGKGSSDLDFAAKDNDVIALIDVDKRNLDAALKKYPNAKGFADFREAFAQLGDKIDAVTVSTSDHAHYPAAMEALKHGKHICVQKPLVNTLWESQQLQLAAKKKGVVTNMGNQGHTGDGIRRLKVWIGQGIVGKVKEIHVWTNRPIWKQGKEVTNTKGPVPDYLNWELWQAQVPDMEYAIDLHPFHWRGWLEYGAGAMGDMGCHLLDGPFYALGLDAPYKIEAESQELSEFGWPKGAKVRAWFKTKDHGDIVLYWYEGKDQNGKPYMPERPKDLEAGRELGNGGFLIVGENGTVYNEGDYSDRPQLLPYSKHQDFLKAKGAPQIERALVPGNPQEEWTQSIKQGKTPGANFDYAVPLTNLCLLGNLAILAQKTVNWNAAEFKTGDPSIDKFIKRAAYREGWEYTADNI